MAVKGRLWTEGQGQHLLVSCRLLLGALAPGLLHVAPAADLSAPLPAPRLPRAFAPFLRRDEMEMREGCGYEERAPQEEGRERGLSSTSSSGTLGSIEGELGLMSVLPITPLPCLRLFQVPLGDPPLG